jgi:hypothetical protein
VAKTTTAERVRLMMTGLKLQNNQVEFGKLAGASRSVVNQWLSGKIASIAPTYAFKLYENTGYLPRWIMLGEGAQKIDQATISVLRLMEGMTPKQREQLFRIGSQLEQ